MSNGNGQNNQKVTITRADLGEGWTAFEAGDPPPKPSETPHFLMRTMNTWLRENPDIRVRAVLPIVMEGNTVAIHVWYDAE